MSYHHPNSPSNLGRRRLCPGSYKEEAGVPEIVEAGEAAEFGTEMHKECEGMLDVWRRHVVEGKEWAPPLPIWDDTADDLARRCIAWLKSKSWVGPGVDIYIEAPLALYGEDGAVLTSGTADLLLVGQDWVRVVDWKSNREPLEKVTAAMQINAYVAAAMQSFNKPEGFGYLHQPRLEDTYTYEIDHLPSAIKIVASIVDACKDPEPEYNEGEHCGFCNGKLTCPLVSKRFKQVAAMPVGIQEGMTNKEVEIVAREYLMANKEAIQQYADALHLIEPLARATRAAVLRCLKEDPDSVEGWTTRSQQSRSVVDPIKLYELCRERGVGEQEFMDTCSVKIGELEKEYVRVVQNASIKEGNKQTKRAIRQDFQNRTEGAGGPVKRNEGVAMLIPNKKKGDDGDSRDLGKITG